MSETIAPTALQWEFTIIWGSLTLLGLVMAIVHRSPTAWRAILFVLIGWGISFLVKGNAPYYPPNNLIMDMVLICAAWSVWERFRERFFLLIIAVGLVKLALHSVQIRAMPYDFESAMTYAERYNALYGIPLLAIYVLPWLPGNWNQSSRKDGDAVDDTLDAISKVSDEKYDQVVALVQRHRQSRLNSPPQSDDV